MEWQLCSRSECNRRTRGELKRRPPMRLGCPQYTIQAGLDDESLPQPYSNHRQPLPTNLSHQLSSLGSRTKTLVTWITPLLLLRGELPSIHCLVRANNHRRNNYPVLASSPPKTLPSQSVEDDGDCPAEEETPAKLSPGTPQLKGTQWPGMDLFDAAPEELRRKRNQRKDASVLRNLQRNATRVEPTETVHSAAGRVLKRRHMDDLENDSPVEGETVIEKPTPKRRKASAPRAKRRLKEVKKPRGRPRKNLETPSKLPSSSIDDMVRSTSRFSPTEDESREFKLAIRSFGQKRKKGNFTVYQDSPPSFGGDGSSEMIPPAYVDANAARPQLTYSSPPWQRPQAEAYDPFKLIRERFSDYPAFPDVGQGKENAAALNMNISPQGHTTMNPLFSQAGMDRFAVGRTPVNPNRFNPVVAPSFDPFNENDAFLPVRNPLMAALARLNESPRKREEFGFDADTTGFATQYRQPLFAP